VGDYRYDFIAMTTSLAHDEHRWVNFRCPEEKAHARFVAMRLIHVERAKMVLYYR